MGFGKIILLFDTLKHLRFKQIYYRLYYFLRKNKYIPSKTYPRLSKKAPQVNWELNEILAQNSAKNKTFTFLNQSKTFNGKIDWNFHDYGKLWTYNLNYFDFLNQKNITLDEGLFLLKDYIKNDKILKDGKEPYPISLRGINWIKFLSKNRIKNHTIDEVLYYHYRFLLSNLEYHLLANHLLENAFSLFFGAYYFQDEAFYKSATKILKEELNEQLLNDGGHFELSPMYHQILLHRLLDCISLVSQNKWKAQEQLTFLTEKASDMLSWLHTMTFKNGEIPMLNDSTYNIAPTSSELFSYAKTLELEWTTKRDLTDSGYRKFSNCTYELIIDVGNIKPSYQPGHAHSDTFSFELYHDKKPLIVDTGISTYQKNKLRQTERSTSSHNTVQIADFEQSQIWGGFRVGKRAKIVALKEGKSMVKASHNGYKNLGITHERTFEIENKQIIINDKLSKKTNLIQKAYFHLHPELKNVRKIDQTIHIDNYIKITFKGVLDIELSKYQYSLGFNLTREALKITVYFDQTLETQIHF